MVPLKLDHVTKLTLDISRIHIPVPDPMAGDRDVLTHIAGVEKPRADELVAEESRLVLIGERPFWRSVAAAGDESGQGSDRAEDDSEALHLVEDCDGLAFWK